VRISISTKVFIGFAVVILAFGSTCAYTLYRMSVLRQSMSLLWEEVMPVSAQLKDLSRRLRAPEEFLAMRRTSDADWLARLLPTMEPFQHTLRIEERLSALAQHPALPEEDKIAFLNVVEASRVFRLGHDLEKVVRSKKVTQLSLLKKNLPASSSNEEVFQSLVQRIVQEAQSGTLQPNSLETQLMVRFLRMINRSVISASRAVSLPINDLVVRAANEEKAATLAVILIAMAALLLSLIMLFVIRLTLKPLGQLRQGAKRIADGDYDEEVRVVSQDEIGQLAKEFNTMADALRTRDRALARQREELLRADRLATIGKIAAQITHEVRNPLSSIGLNAELLEEELLDDHSAKEAKTLLGAIQQEVVRLKSITEEYLSYARMPKIERTSVDIRRLLDQILTFMVREFEATDVELATEGVRSAENDEIITVFGDADQLRQGFLNILRNSIEALCEVSQPRKIEVRVESLLKGVKIQFIDNGPGIDPSIVPRIFDPFVTGKGEGTGLGLALTQQIVVEHGGRIEVSLPQDDEPMNPQARKGAIIVLEFPKSNIEASQVVHEAR
jgi:two-component system NtrC family sensor kinase